MAQLDIPEAARQAGGFGLPLRMPRNWSPQPPRSPIALSIAGLAISIAAVAATAGTGLALHATLAGRGIIAPYIDIAIVLCVIASAALLLPALRALVETRRCRRVLAADISEARAAAAAARAQVAYTFGYAVALLLCLGFVLFIIANDLAVGETFFYVPLIRDTFWLILQAFAINVEIFCFAQALVLIWGLAIAIARLTPGDAGRPVRLIATIYVDLFRALPAIISIYLIGFGLPLSGLPFFDKVPAMWLAVLALTITYGAYVSEVYRAGIESVHWSQTAAARSLGLSYGQTLRYVIVPQAVRRIIPPLLNDFISLQKDTALVSVIGTIDAFNQAKMVASNHFNLSSVTTVAMFFIIITIPQARLVDRLMAADQRRMRSG